VTAKLYEQCVRVYDAMLECSDDGEYEGYLTYLFQRLDIGLSHYTPVIRRMQAMGCIKKVAAGSRNVPSKWKVIMPPTEAKFIAARGTRRSRIQELEDRVAALEEARAS
jgi:hypothetical protein